MDSFYPYFAKHKEFVLIVCDMGFAVLDKYFENYPERVILMGISEQATIGIAAGMALEGLRPVIYSQAPFITMRCFEQLRYDANEHNLQVIVIGVGACNYFNKLGRSHCIDNDDIKLMSLLDNFLVLLPEKETIQENIRKMVLYKGPVYVSVI